MVTTGLTDYSVVATLDNTTFVIFACSEFPMNPIVNAPIHAATTTLTATVTAISMIVAITGLNAFALFLNFLKFILFSTPPRKGYLVRSLIYAFKYYDLINNIMCVYNKDTRSLEKSLRILNTWHFFILNKS